MDKRIKNFKNFLYLCWKHLNLQEPTPIQYDIADYLQSEEKRLVIEAFRGVIISRIPNLSLFIPWDNVSINYEIHISLHVTD